MNNTLIKTVLTKNCGKIDPNSIDDYINAGGYKALQKAIKMTPVQIVEEIKASNLKGRGGAGFPTGIKMEAVLKINDTPKYIVCNADEGEPGNFKDKLLLENDPHQILEGMIIAAFALNIQEGFIYIRGEYNQSIDTLNTAIEQATKKGFLGNNICGSSYSLNIEVFSGAGAYICGEEFALIESIEGKSGRPRNKPPFPTVCGLFNKPTLINNVETFSNLPFIINEGAKAFTAIGTASSSGTKLVCLSGNVKNGGVYEVPFGVSVRQIIEELGGGVPENRKIKMVQLGGASGPIIPPSMLDIKLDYSEMADLGLSMGSGAIIVIDERFEMFQILNKIIKFFKHESCGKCTPCREGNQQMLIILSKLENGTATLKDIKLLETLCNVMVTTSFCGLGQAAPTAIMTTLKYFNEEYTKKCSSQNAKV